YGEEALVTIPTIVGGGTGDQTYPTITSTRPGQFACSYQGHDGSNFELIYKIFDVGDPGSGPIPRCYDIKQTTPGYPYFVTSDGQGGAIILHVGDFYGFHYGLDVFAEHIGGGSNGLVIV